MSKPYCRRIVPVLSAAAALAVWMTVAGGFLIPEASAQSAAYASGPEAEEGGLLNFTVRKPKRGSDGFLGYIGSIAYSYRTVDDTATAGTDYVATQGSVTLGPGVYVAVGISVWTKADSVSESAETVIL